jgi:hypothetical protein
MSKEKEEAKQPKNAESREVWMDEGIGSELPVTNSGSNTEEAKEEPDNESKE